MLDMVTITGADDSIGRPENLIPLMTEFPFTELGILISGNPSGASRFPSSGWLLDFIRTAAGCRWKTSLHVCGRWVRDMLVGMGSTSLVALAYNFGRIQLNFHADKTECRPLEFARELRNFGKKQIIFQIDGEDGNKHLQSVYDVDPMDGAGIDAVGLFDVSGGRGILPEVWPTPYFMENDEDYAYHGYAGGLGPDNLEDQLPRIHAASKGCRHWVDMETLVRSDDDKQFDLDKVRRCLEIAKRYLNRE